jgi:hypothetical protein
MSTESLDEAIAKLRDAADLVADQAIDLLRAALSEENPKTSSHAAQEKILTRARRSIEKAIHLIEGVEIGD